MGLTIPVILNSVNNLSDARYAAGMGVDMMGFETETGGERYVSPELFKAITSWLSGIQTVVEVTVLTPELLLTIQEHYQPDLIQFEKIEGVDSEALSSYACIQKFTFEKGKEKESLEAIEDQLTNNYSYILFELSDWSDWRLHTDFLSELNERNTILWALPIEKEDVELIQELELKGISLKGGDEQRPGWKDLDQLIDILEALEEN